MFNHSIHSRAARPFYQIMSGCLRYQMSLQHFYIIKTMRSITKSLGCKLGITADHTELINPSLAGIAAHFCVHGLAVKDRKSVVEGKGPSRFVSGAVKA